MFTRGTTGFKILLARWLFDTHSGEHVQELVHARSIILRLTKTGSRIDHLPDFRGLDLPIITIKYNMLLFKARPRKHLQDSTDLDRSIIIMITVANCSFLSLADGESY